MSDKPKISPNTDPIISLVEGVPTAYVVIALIVGIAIGAALLFALANVDAGLSTGSEEQTDA